jgi:hypothetical protein
MESHTAETGDMRTTRELSDAIELEPNTSTSEEPTANPLGSEQKRPSSSEPKPPDFAVSKYKVCVSDCDNNKSTVQTRYNSCTRPVKLSSKFQDYVMS